MRFLIDADLPRSVAPLLSSFGHDGVDVRDVGLGQAEDREIASFARQHGLCLLTGDLDFSDIRTYPPQQYHGLVVLRMPRHVTSRHILQLLESLLGRPDLLEKIGGKLAIVEPGRVRIHST